MIDRRELRAALGEQLFDFVRDPLFVVDVDGVFVDLNEAAARYLKRPTLEMVGRSVTEVFPPEQTKIQLGVIRDVIETGEPFVEERTTAIGDDTFVFQYSLRPLDAPDGTRIGALGMVRDITEFVALERRYTALYEGATDALFTIDVQGGIRGLNRESEVLSGYSRSELEKLTIWEVIHPEEIPRLKAYLMARATGGEAPSRYENRWVHGASGETRWGEVKISTRPIRPGVFQASVRDITERKQLEALRRDFVHMVSHDVKTPLTVVLGFANSLLKGLYGDLNDRQSESLSHIVAASTQMRALMERFVLAERLDSDEPRAERPQPLDVMLDARVAFARPAAADKGVSLELTGRPPVDCKVSDGDGLRQIVDNLISNAVKFTPEGGRVSVRADLRGGEACIEVSDTGPGIPENERDRVFERFFRGSSRADTRGSGLGLYIVKRLVDCVGGRLVLDGSPGGGARFRVWLPVVEPGPPGEDRDGGRKTPTPNGQ